MDCHHDHDDDGSGSVDDIAMPVPNSRSSKWRHMKRMLREDAAAEDISSDDTEMDIPEMSSSRSSRWRLFKKLRDKAEAGIDSDNGDGPSSSTTQSRRSRSPSHGELEDMQPSLEVDDDDQAQQFDDQHLFMSSPLHSWVAAENHSLVTEDDDYEIADEDAEIMDEELDILVDEIADEELHVPDTEGNNVNPGDLEDTEDDNDADEGSKPLYEGAPVTLLESVLMILTFAMKHQLTGVA
ncbi:uncharacterized protein [Amphiura filiformis]|uniref:uncharacterized protein n=1 Tax=Amphiura filiformis TaxID=82378 RepID=UPI003B210A6A